MRREIGVDEKRLSREARIRPIARGRAQVTMPTRSSANSSPTTRRRWSRSTATSASLSTKTSAARPLGHPHQLGDLAIGAFGSSPTTSAMLAKLVARAARPAPRPRDRRSRRRRRRTPRADSRVRESSPRWRTGVGLSPYSGFSIATRGAILGSGGAGSAARARSASRRDRETRSRASEHTTPTRATRAAAVATRSIAVAAKAPPRQRASLGRRGARRAEAGR